MDKQNRELFAMVNRNYEDRAFADRLKAISARRKRNKKKGGGKR